MPDGSRLTPKESLFCQNRAQGQGKAASAINAGYAASAAGKVAHTLLKRKEIQDEITKLVNRAADLALINAQDTLVQIARTAFFDSHEILALCSNPYGHDWSKNARAAISSIKVTRTYKGKEEEDNLVDVTYEIKTRDTLRALKMLGDHTGAFTDLNIALAALRTYGIEIANVDGRWQVLEDASVS